MKATRHEVCKYLDKCVEGYLIQGKNDSRTFVQKAAELYNIPEQISADVMGGTISLLELNDFTLFSMLDTLANVWDKKIDIEKYFTPEEIETYQKSFFEQKQISWPIVFTMMELTHNQWIGKISLEMLMQLRDAQVINYNRNTQRVMKHVVRGEETIYKIHVNDKAVESIKNAILDGTYQPTVLTLNIVPGKKEGYYIPPKGRKMEFQLLEGISNVDMVDGYHRYLALGEIWDENPGFEFTMGLRITYFTEEEAQAFIWQEDQKTKMKKADAASFNMNDISNIVVSNVNSTANSCMRGLISRNGGIISFQLMSQIVKALWFGNARKMKKAERNVQTLAVSDQIIKRFNYLASVDPTFVTEEYDFLKLLVTLYVFYEAKDEQGLEERIKSLLQVARNSDSLILRDHKLKAGTITVLRKLEGGE